MMVLILVIVFCSGVVVDQSIHEWNPWKMALGSVGLAMAIALTYFQ